MEVNEQEVSKSIDKYSSTKLAEMVVCYRYLGLYKDASVSAMEELGRRRANGDAFDFEKYIDDKLATLPELKAKTSEVNGIMNTVKNLIGRLK